MMKRILMALSLTSFATAADATGGFVCRTAGPNPVEASVGFGHVPGSPLIATRLTDRGKPVAARQAQWWFDKDELRLLLISEDAMREELVMRARRNGQHYDGSLWRDGKRRWVRCKEA